MRWMLLLFAVLVSSGCVRKPAETAEHHPPRTPVAEGVSTQGAIDNRPKEERDRWDGCATPSCCH